MPMVKLKQLSRPSRTAIGLRAVAIAQRLEVIFAGRMAKILETILEQQRQLILDRLESNAVKSYVRKLDTRDVFSIEEFRQALAVGFVGLDELMVQGYQLGQENLNLFAPAGEVIGTAQPNRNTLAALTRALTAFHIEGIASGTAQYLRNQAITSPDPQAFAKVIQQSGQFSPSRARMIARTETSAVLNRGQVAAWEDTGVVELVEWYVSPADVCPWCESFDGKITTLGGNFASQGETVTAGGQTLEVFENLPSPPLHPNCRCTLLPVVD